MSKDCHIKIPAELFAVAESSQFSGELTRDNLQVGPDEYLFDTPLTWSVDVTNTGSAFLVAGVVQGVAHCACARCLEEVEHRFEGAIEGYFLIGATAGEEFDEWEEDLGEDEFDALPDDHVIDLKPLIEAALMVDAPAMPLCREDCRGLCPNCGANLNEGSCECDGDPLVKEFDRIANPFAALAQLEFDDE